MEKYKKHLAMGLNALETGNEDIAATHFMKAYEENRPDPISAYAYANELYKRNNFPEVVKVLFDSVSSGNQTVAAACIYVRALSMLGKYNDAVEILSEYQTKNPHNSLIILTKAEIALNHKKFKIVKEVVKEAQQNNISSDIINQINSRLHHIEGLEEAKKENWDKAEQLFKKSIKLDPSWYGPIINLGSILEIKGKKEEAYNTFKSIYPKDTENPVLLYNLTRISIKTGKIIEAKRYFKELKSVSSDYPGIKNLEQQLSKVLD